MGGGGGVPCFVSDDSSATFSDPFSFDFSVFISAADGFSDFSVAFSAFSAFSALTDFFVLVGFISIMGSPGNRANASGSRAEASMT